VEQIGGYRLESKLGEGGMGAVFRATNPRFPGRVFALKVLTEATDETALERFHREMKALSVATTHPNVVRIFGGTVEGARAFYVMELVQGKPLSSLAYENPFEPVRAARIVRAISDAIAHVHHQGVIHRDLKPANVILEANDTPRILDFGLASMAGEDRLTKTGAFLGTPSYAAPEQLDGRSHEADARADVYALGGVLHFLLTGKAPFEASSDAELLPKVLLNPALPPSKHAPGVPVELDAVCLKALEKEARDRYPTAADFREELDRFLRGDHVLARVPGRREKLVKSLRRHRREVAVVGVALVVLVVAAIVALRIHTQRIERYRGRAESLATTEETEVGEILRALSKGGGSDEVRRAVQEHVKKFRDAVEEGTKIRRELGLDDPTRARSILESGEKLLRRRDEVLGEPPSSRANRERTSSLLIGAARGLAADQADREARWVSALASLAERGSEREPFGEGRLPDPSNKTLGPDLEAAAVGSDALATRAAGLVVDLAIATSDRKRAGEVFEARRAALDPAVRESFERVLAGSLDGEELARKLPEQPAAARRAAGELARRLALLGAPNAIEHPEAADPSVSLELIARRDHPMPHPTVRPEPNDVVKELIALHNDLSVQLGALHTDVFGFVPLATTQAKFEAIRPHFEELVLQALKFDPRDPAALSRAGYTLRQRISTGPFMILTACEAPAQCLYLAMAFNGHDRTITRSGNSLEYLDEAAWEIPWGDFDARLAKDLAEDPLAATIAKDRLTDAAVACQGLYRLDLLARAEDGSVQLDPAARRKLALETVVRLDRLRAIGPDVALPFAARLDRLALPPPLSERLAELELRRAIAFAEEIRAQQDALRADGQGESPQGVSLGFHFHAVLIAAMAAAEDPRAVTIDGGLHFKLYDLAMKIVRGTSLTMKGALNSLDYLAVRNIGKQLHLSLENDPRRHEWRKDFEPQ